MGRPAVVPKPSRGRPMACASRLCQTTRGMKRRGTALLLAATVVLAAATAALADAGRVADEIVSTVLPVTPAQAREIATLLRAPGTVAVDVVDTTDAVVDIVAALPAGLLHDVVTTPVRHWHVVRGLVADTVEIVARPPDAPRGLFRHTVTALHRSRLFSATASAVRRITEPTNQTGRLAIVLTARAYGLAAQDGHLEALRRAIDREDPDLGPLLRAMIEMMAKSYGRDALRVVLD